MMETTIYASVLRKKDFLFFLSGQKLHKNKTAGIKAKLWMFRLPFMFLAFLAVITWKSKFNKKGHFWNWDFLWKLSPRTPYKVQSDKFRS